MIQRHHLVTDNQQIQIIDLNVSTWRVTLDGRSDRETNLFTSDHNFTSPIISALSIIIIWLFLLNRAFPGNFRLLTCIQVLIQSDEKYWSTLICMLPTEHETKKILIFLSVEWLVKTNALSVSTALCCYRLARRPSTSHVITLATQTVNKASTIDVGQLKVNKTSSQSAVQSSGGLYALYRSVTDYAGASCRTPSLPRSFVIFHTSDAYD